MDTAFPSYSLLRGELRETMMGEVLWSYASENGFPEFIGSLVDISDSGLGICTRTRFSEGEVLKVHVDSIWKNYRYGTILWVRQDGSELYRSGLRLI